MRTNTWMVIGTSVAAAAVLILGLAYATVGTANAGISVPCGSTATPTLQLGEIQAAFQVAPCTPTAIPTTAIPSETATPGRLKTQTPTATSTQAPRTATPVPPTVAAPTNTRVPANGNEGVAVKPPNTGSGGGAGNGTTWVMGLGALLVVLGGGAALVGVKQRS